MKKLKKQLEGGVTTGSTTEECTAGSSSDDRTKILTETDARTGVTRLVKQNDKVCITI